MLPLQHPYGQPSSVENSVHWDAVSDVYAAMVANGDGHKLVLGTAFAPPAPPPPPSSPPGLPVTCLLPIDPATYPCLLPLAHRRNFLGAVNEYGWDTSDEGFKSAALLSALQGFATSNFSYVAFSTYLALTDLPGTPGDGKPLPWPRHDGSRSRSQAVFFSCA